MTSMVPTLNEGFTTASLEGAYAVTSVSTGGHRESAAIGVFRFSRTGRFTGNITINGVGQLFGERQVMQASLDGTYVVDEIRFLPCDRELHSRFHPRGHDHHPHHQG